MATHSIVKLVKMTHRFNLAWHRKYHFMYNTAIKHHKAARKNFRLRVWNRRIMDQKTISGRLRSAASSSPECRDWRMDSFPALELVVKAPTFQIESPRCFQSCFIRIYCRLTGPHLNAKCLVLRQVEKYYPHTSKIRQATLS